MIEEWRDVDGYVGIYQVSNLGRVRSLDREVKHPVNGVFTKKSRILKVSQKKGGYLSVVLNGSHKLVHSLAIEAFVGPKEEGCECDHIDDNPENNNVNNLQYLTRKENSMKAKKKTGRRGVQKRSYKNGSVKYRVRMNIDGTQPLGLGQFDTEEEAYKCFYDTFLEWNGVPPWGLED